MSRFHRPIENILAPRSTSQHWAPAGGRSDGPDRYIRQLGRIVDADIAFLSSCVSKDLNRLINRQPIASIDEQPVLLDIDLRNRPKIYPSRPLNIVDHHLLIVEHFRTEQSDSEDQVTAQLWSSDPMSIHTPETLQFTRQTHQRQPLLLKIHHRPVRHSNFGHPTNLATRRVL